MSIARRPSSNTVCNFDSVCHPEPQVTSLNSDERKLARRLRIERRLKKSRRDKLEAEQPGFESSDQTVPRSLLQQQLDKSEEILAKLILEGYDNVTAIRRVGVGKEVDGREVKNIERQEIMDHLENDTSLSRKMFDEISNKWLTMLKYDDPIHVHEAMESQREKLAQLLQLKDATIATLKQEIREVDTKFTDGQFKENAEIKTLADQIQNQVKTIRKTYREELKTIEAAILVDRHQLTQAHDQTWQELFNKRETEERTQLETKLSQNSDFLRKMDELNVIFQDNYRQIYICLQNECANLGQHFEHIKASVVKNREKADYNYQILRKREDENIIIKSQQKRRMNKLQDTINALRKKNRDYEEKTKLRMTQLSAEVKNLRKCVAEIGNKAKSLSKINDLKHRQVWDLNIDDADKLLKRILTIDQILHEQHLGVEWKKPDAMLLTKADLRSYREGKVPGGKTARRSASATKMVVGSNIEFKRNFEYKSLLKTMIGQLVDETGFLIEEKLEALLAPYTTEEQDIFRVDGVFDALGIKNIKDVDLMFKHFFAYARCVTCHKSAEELEVTDRTLLLKQVSFHDTLTNRSSFYFHMPDTENAVNEPDEVINDVLHKFVKESTGGDSLRSLTSTDSLLHGASTISQANSIITNLEVILANDFEKRSVIDRLTCSSGHPLAINSANINKALQDFLAAVRSKRKTMDTTAEPDATTVSRSITTQDMISFWDKYREVFSDSKDRLWSGLLLGLTRYYDILRDRKKLSTDVICLRKKNKEFKEILKIYRRRRAKGPPCAQQREIPIASQFIHCAEL